MIVAQEILQHMLSNFISKQFARLGTFSTKVIRDNKLPTLQRSPRSRQYLVFYTFPFIELQHW